MFWSESGESEDDEDLAEADEDESDLDLAWKMLDVARAIADKLAVDTLDKVDILSTLAEVALERGMFMYRPLSSDTISGILCATLVNHC